MEALAKSEVPDWVPSTLRRSQVATVLAMTDEQVAYLTRRGKIPTLNDEWRDFNEQRLYNPEAVAAFARFRRITPNWETLRE